MIATDHMTNPEFPQQSSTRRTNAVENQLFVLRSSIEQLRKAYNGHDVEWSDVGKYRLRHLSAIAARFTKFTY